MKKIIWVLTILILPVLVQATTIHVPTDQSTLLDALSFAMNNDTIKVADGVYSGEGFHNLVFNDTINIVLMSQNGYENCTIDLQDNNFIRVGDNSTGIWSDGSVVINGFTITNGNIVFKYEFGGDLTIQNSLVKKSDVGAFIDYPGAGGFYNCILDSNNTAAWLIGGPEFFHISNSILSHNQTALSITPGWNNHYFGNIFAENIKAVVFGGGCCENFNSNIFLNNDTGIVDYDGSEISLQGNNNNFHNNGVSYYNFENENSIFPSFLTNNLGYNPLFCNLEFIKKKVYPNSPMLPQNNNNNVLIGNVTEGCFYCGDLDSTVNYPDIADLVYFVNFMFAEGSPPTILETANLDGNEVIDIADLVYFVDYMFGGGPALACNNLY